MAGMARRHARRLLGACLAATLGAAGAPGLAQPATTGPGQLLGVWRGTSLCTDLVAAPACHDEVVLYEFTAGSRAGAVRWTAEKIVNGQRQRMGELELVFDEAEACWRAEFESPRIRSVWCLVVEGVRLKGTARLLPGNEVVRKVDLRKE
jgi:hypothetical protein